MPHRRCTRRDRAAVDAETSGTMGSRSGGARARPRSSFSRSPGSNAREAVSLVRVGTMMATDAAAASSPRSRLRRCCTVAACGAVRSGGAAIDRRRRRHPGRAGNARRRGRSARCSSAGLAEAAAILLGESQIADRWSGWRRVRGRCATNSTWPGCGCGRRSASRQRFLHLTPQADGMTRLSGLLDPESAAVVGAAFDAATSPRRGGPRFVDPEARRRRADELVADEPHDGTDRPRHVRRV